MEPNSNVASAIGMDYNLFYYPGVDFWRWQVPGEQLKEGKVPTIEINPRGNNTLRPALFTWVPGDLPKPVDYEEATSKVTGFFGAQTFPVRPPGILASPMETQVTKKSRWIKKMLEYLHA